ncbi:septal ring lytic transglycosylase RlpA family protein [Paraurantiacibacter namhicola]|uniref:septal ring lytic transglycosylase RlpA family protein n=1 Tax=Paraurantiacibacter namhicola TaxID=645517 RepID=UPI001F269F29|nr:septal ring lytic transglycosylase RlpA family protein [Paraurantiacibacter namhicola]
MNAQTVPVEDQPAVSSAIGGVDGEARFVPSDEAQLSEVSFEEGFEAYSGDVDPGAIPPHAVRLDTFDPPLEVEPEPRSGRSLGMGVASYYGARFAGRLTANGERFNPREMTAAHKTLPFGTRVRVTNPRNGKSVIVRINDRGPFIRGRTIDLSRGAAEEIGIVRAGHGRVAMEIVE